LRPILLVWMGLLGVAIMLRAAVSGAGRPPALLEG
jgi:hypothetical protein